MKRRRDRLFVALACAEWLIAVAVVGVIIAAHSFVALVIMALVLALVIVAGFTIWGAASD